MAPAPERLVVARRGETGAGDAVQDAEFKRRWDKAALQRNVCTELRRHPLIGADLNEHANTAGSITDLSLHGIPIELKAVDTLINSLDQCEPFLGQTTSYAIAKSKRTATLCVLDSSNKKTAPMPTEAVLDIRTQAQGAVSICVLVIHGDLALPRALSREGGVDKSDILIWVESGRVPYPR